MKQSRRVIVPVPYAGPRSCATAALVICAAAAVAVLDIGTVPRATFSPARPARRHLADAVDRRLGSPRRRGLRTAAAERAGAARGRACLTYPARASPGTRLTW